MSHISSLWRDAKAIPLRRGLKNLDSCALSWEITTMMYELQDALVYFCMAKWATAWCNIKAVETTVGR